MGIVLQDLFMTPTIGQKFHQKGNGNPRPFNDRLAHQHLWVYDNAILAAHRVSPVSMPPRVQCTPVALNQEYYKALRMCRGHAAIGWRQMVSLLASWSSQVVHTRGYNFKSAQARSGLVAAGASPVSVITKVVAPASRSTS